jgi:hypothetical protein
MIAGGQAAGTVFRGRSGHGDDSGHEAARIRRGSSRAISPMESMSVRNQEIEEAHRSYLEEAEGYLERARKTRAPMG